MSRMLDIIRKRLVTQRWDGGRDSYRPSDETFDPNRYFVKKIEKAPAKSFVLKHHYSRTFPGFRTAAGLFDVGKAGQKERLVGVLVFGVFSNNASPKKWAQISNHRDAGDLSRLVLLDEVKGNAETWFVRQAIPIGQKYYEGRRTVNPDGDTMRVLISHSDPYPLLDVDGNVVMPGHIGNIYQAMNARFLGRSSSSKKMVSPGGVTISGNALSKLRSADPSSAHYRRHGKPKTGWNYVEEMLRNLGAPKKSARQSYTDWVSSLYHLPGWRAVPHPGNLVYGWALGGRLDANLSPRQDRKVRRLNAEGFPMTDLDAWISQVISERRHSYDAQMMIHQLRPRLVSAPSRDLLSHTPLDPAYLLERITTPHHKTRRPEGAPKNVQAEDGYRGLTQWLSIQARKKRRTSMDDVQAWLDRHAYPKKPRQRYIGVLRKYRRAWSRGNLDRAGQLAEMLHDTWGGLDSGEREGLDAPPAMRCSATRGSANRSRGMTLGEVQRQVLCRGSRSHERHMVDSALAQESMGLMDLAELIL
jgi:hypothetical protein